MAKETTTTSGGSTGRQADWASQTVDQIDGVVAKIRANTTDRLDRVVRAVVYGILAGIVAIMAGVLGVVMLVRVLDILIPQEVWLTYLILGGLFCGTGALLWSKRSQ